MIFIKKNISAPSLKAKIYNYENLAYNVSKKKHILQLFHYFRYLESLTPSAPGPSTFDGKNAAGAVIFGCAEGIEPENL